MPAILRWHLITSQIGKSFLTEKKNAVFNTRTSCLAALFRISIYFIAKNCQKRYFKLINGHRTNTLLAPNYF